MTHSTATTPRNCWIEISKSALHNNLVAFKQLLQPNQQLLCVVKANAYGHDAQMIAEAAMEFGADWLGVFQVEEGVLLRKAGLRAPILVLGPSFGEQFQIAAKYELQLTIPSLESINNYTSNLPSTNVPIHLKLETGTNRQGIRFEELEDVSKIILSNQLSVQGAYTHYADIEDTTDHDFATSQRLQFENSIEKLNSLGINIPFPHTACTAATILFPKTYFQLVRVGIGMYGLWPSKETNVSAHTLGRAQIELQPVMQWKTRITQIKQVPAGEFVGYGRTFRTTRKTTLAIVPVGYADGYSRRFSNAANTLVRGTRARVVGRVCMNLSMIDVTDVPGAQEGDVVTLLGTDGDETVSAEQLATLADTINYEIVTRAAPGAPRIWV
ncbi:MAG: alanine racemase [Deltaproteobacteria bacterium]|nr:alanine racemase [Deltaproteobacteria bacterium]MBN2672528.1 alanine racemase [Deltaproteobacteria bacterium]